jgi:hypothetical protein
MTLEFLYNYFKNAGMPHRGYLAVVKGYHNIDMPHRGYPKKQ